MLQNLRKRTQGVGFKIVIGLIILSFAGFGIQSILLDGGQNEVAVVNGEKITPQELQMAVQNQKRRLYSMFGYDVDPAMLADERLQPQAIQTLISRKLLKQSAQDMGLAVSEREVGAVVSSQREFQVNGQFSPETYKAVLSEAGFTPSSYKVGLKDDLVLNQVSRGLAGSEFVTQSELEISARIISEQRDFSYLVLPREDYAQAQEVSDQEVQEYYEASIEDFRAPETLDLDYIKLTIDDFRQPVDERTLQEAYELAIDGAEYKTQHRVSHILFEEDAGQRVAQAREMLAGGTSFAELARELSDDVGSADLGGDLGYTSGDVFPDEMEAAIHALEPGVVSEPIETDAGVHLLLVTERKPGEAPSFEEMRGELEEGIQLEEARVELVRTVELLSDLIFNASDLESPAKELGLKVQSRQAVSRAENEGLFANPQLLEAAFSGEVYSDGHNSDVIELPGDTFVALRVRSHNPSEIRPLEEVRGDIVASIEAAATEAAVSAEADNALEKLRAGVSLEEYAAGQDYEAVIELGVDRRNTVVPPEVLRRVFELSAPTDDLVSTDYIFTLSGDAVVINLQAVTPGEYNSLPEEEQQQMEQALTGELGGLVFQEYRRGLMERAEISVM